MGIASSAMMRGRRGKRPSPPLILDDKDSDLAGIQWWLNLQGYPRARVRIDDRIHCLPHRIVMERLLGRPIRSDESVDHINRNKLDNRRRNLRVVSQSIQARNRGLSTANKSGMKNIRRKKGRKLSVWVWSFKVEGKRYSGSARMFCNGIKALRAARSSSGYNDAIDRRAVLNQYPF